MALGERAGAYMALGAAPQDLLACARRGLAASRAAKATGLRVEIVAAYFAGYEDARSQAPSLPTLFVALRKVSASSPPAA
jgi:hypothetical protein